MARFSVEDEVVADGGGGEERRFNKKRKAAIDSGKGKSRSAVAGREEDDDGNNEDGGGGAAAMDGEEAGDGEAGAASGEPSGQADDAGGARGSGITVNIDPDILDCSICCEPLSAPVFQVNNKCHICCHFIGNIRCLAMEMMIDSVRIPCPNSMHGCKELLSNTQRYAHEDTCVHAPCFCPEPSCSFSGTEKRLAAHFRTCHKGGTATPFSCYGHPFRVRLPLTEPHVIIQAPDGFLFLLLNDSSPSEGNAVSLCCIRRGGSMAGQLAFAYKICAEGRAASKLRLKGTAPSIRKWAEVYPTDVFLSIPRDFFASAPETILDVSIWKTKPAVD